MTALPAAEAGLIACPTCRLLSRPGDEGRQACPRCGSELTARKPRSLARTTAFLVAAVAMFLPANLLPVLTTRSVLSSRSDTIMSGVVELWHTGSWPLAVLVFVASIVVPGLKILALSLLVVSSARRSTWRAQERTRLYRMLEWIGRWSMLDILVMSLLAALLRSPAASVQVEPGALAFAAVVVLTMLSSASFDPRLIWDAGQEDEDEENGTAALAYGRNR
jgi:paraquat-inducible protein A